MTGSMLHAERWHAYVIFCGSLGADAVLHVATLMNSQTPARAGWSELCLLLLQASAFVMFPDVMSACKAAGVLRSETAVDAVEIFDRKSLK